MELCEEVERRTGSRVSKWWWEQEEINLAVMWVVETTPGETEEAEGVEGGGGVLEV